MGYSYKQEQKNKKAYFFFGEDGFTQANQNEIRYSSVIDSDHIILRTRNVRRVFVGENSIGYVFATGKNRGVYLKPWQVMRIRINDSENPQNLNLIKLNRKYFKTYYINSRNIVDRDGNGFAGITIDRDPTFDVMLEAAAMQGRDNKKVEIVV